MKQILKKELQVSKQTIVLPQFFKDLIEFSKKEQKQIAKTVKLMEQNIKHPSLNCHEVKGTVYHEVYVNKDIRIIFESSTDFYVLYRVVHHDGLYKL